MFEMHADAEILAVASAAALSALVVALPLARWIRTPLDRLRETTARLAAGDLSARAATSGPVEVAEVARSVNAMADSIERLFDARRELVAWASHDLRTPLASMQAMIEAIDDGLADPHEYMPALGDHVRTLSALVDDLFELARIDAGVLTVHLEAVDPARVVGSCVRAFQAEARARGISLEAHTGDAAVPVVMCAPDKVERVLHNLLANALRHTPSDGAIAVVAHPRRGERHDRGRGHRRGARRGGGGADVRAVLAQRGGAKLSGVGAGSRDRPPPNRGPRRPDLGGEPPRRWGADRVHAAGREGMSGARCRGAAACRRTSSG